MARPIKTHIRNPRQQAASICGRLSVGFADKRSEATCTTCQRCATDGTLEKLDFEASSEDRGQAGRNNSGMPRFTEMQRKFASHPVVTTNPQQAALDAGYSPLYARQHASALRKQLAPLIMQNQEAAKKISAISVSKVQTELAAMGFANIIDYFDIDEESGEIRPKQLNQLTREQSAAIQEVKVVDVVDEITGKTTFVIGSIKLADKRANLVELGKTLGMFNKITIEDKREETLMIADVPTDALEEAEALLIAAASQAKENRRKREALPGDFKDVTGEADGSPTEQE